MNNYVTCRIRAQYPPVVIYETILLPEIPRVGDLLSVGDFDSIPVKQVHWNIQEYADGGPLVVTIVV